MESWKEKELQGIQAPFLGICDIELESDATFYDHDAFSFYGLGRTQILPGYFSVAYNVYTDDGINPRGRPPFRYLNATCARDDDYIDFVGFMVAPNGDRFYVDLVSNTIDATLFSKIRYHKLSTTTNSAVSTTNMACSGTQANIYMSSFTKAIDSLNGDVWVVSGQRTGGAPCMIYISANVPTNVMIGNPSIGLNWGSNTVVSFAGGRLGGSIGNVWTWTDRNSRLELSASYNALNWLVVGNSQTISTVNSEDTIVAAVEYDEYWYLFTRKSIWRVYAPDPVKAELMLDGYGAMNPKCAVSAMGRIFFADDSDIYSWIPGSLPISITKKGGYPRITKRYKSAIIKSSNNFSTLAGLHFNPVLQHLYVDVVYERLYNETAEPPSYYQMQRKLVYDLVHDVWTEWGFNNKSNVGGDAAKPKTSGYQKVMPSGVYCHTADSGFPGFYVFVGYMVSGGFGYSALYEITNSDRRYSSALTYKDQDTGFSSGGNIEPVLKLPVMLDINSYTNIQKYRVIFNMGNYKFDRFRTGLSGKQSESSPLSDLTYILYTPDSSTRSYPDGVNTNNGGSKSKVILYNMGIVEVDVPLEYQTNLFSDFLIKAASGSSFAINNISIRYMRSNKEINTFI